MAVVVGALEAASLRLLPVQVLFSGLTFRGPPLIPPTTPSAVIYHHTRPHHHHPTTHRRRCPLKLAHQQQL
jgi:hypothetical protein